MDNTINDILNLVTNLRAIGMDSEADKLLRSVNGFLDRLLYAEYHSEHQAKQGDRK